MLQLRRRDIHIIAYRKPTFNGRIQYRFRYKYIKSIG